MSITKKINDRFKTLDKIRENTMRETGELLKEARQRHRIATSRITALSKKKKLSGKQKKEYAETVILRQEAEKAVNMLSAMLDQ